MAFTQIVLKRRIVHGVVICPLYPRHAPRSEIGCWPQAFLLFQNAKTHGRTFESYMQAYLTFIPSNGKYLAHCPAHFPNMRTAPLDNTGRMEQRFAKSIVIVENQILGRLMRCCLGFDFLRFVAGPLFEQLRHQK